MITPLPVGRLSLHRLCCSSLVVMWPLLSVRFFSNFTCLLTVTCVSKTFVNGCVCVCGYVRSTCATSHLNTSIHIQKCAPERLELYGADQLNLSLPFPLHKQFMAKPSVAEAPRDADAWSFSGLCAVSYLKVTNTSAYDLLYMNL